MVKIVGGMFSLSASGTYANAITYVCGEFLRMSQRKELSAGSSRQRKNQTKWKEGTEVWGSPACKKIDWKIVFELIVKSEKCPLEIKTWMNGFQVFMMYYMKKGPGGWVNYPNPPLS